MKINSRLLHRQIGGLGSLQDSVHVVCDAPVAVRLVRPVGHEPARIYKFGELGGKRLELFKEAVPRLARVAVIYDPGVPNHVLELKEVQTAARPLGLTVRSWEVRAADGFEKVFAALSKERPDGFYVPSGPLMTTNRNRIVGFALKSRLPSR